MSTALDSIRRAMRLARLLGDQQELDPQEASDYLESLNSMLDSWSIERLMVYQIKQESFTWPAGQYKRTVGAGANFVTTRPTKITNAFMRDASNNDFPMQVIERGAYDRIPNKVQAVSYPQWCFYDPGMPLGTIYLDGTLSSALTIVFDSWQQFTQFDDLTDDLGLPPGYKEAIDYNLAVRISSENNQPVTKHVQDTAVSSKRAIKNLNAPTLISRMDFAGSRANILRGY